MKTLFIGDRKRVEKFDPHTPFSEAMEKAYVTMADSMEKKLEAGADADFICVDAIAKVPAELIAAMPNLKLIHSEGVGFNGIDCKAAAERGIWVCNNRGINAEAVAEHAIMLILGLQRTLMEGQAAIVAGQQFERKERLMREGIMELGECSVGIIGFGAIGMALAKRLVPFGCRVYYNDCFRRPEEAEREYQVEWMERAEMLATCDIISLHVPVTPDTEGMVDEAFLRAMKPTALLLNTARGELVNNEALCRALTEGWIAGAGLDTMSPEPVKVDHPLLQLPAEVFSKVLLTPHIAGVTTNTFRRGFRNIWNAFEAVSRGDRPANVVNGL